MGVIARIAYRQYKPEDYWYNTWSYSQPIEFVNKAHFTDWSRAWRRKLRDEFGLSHKDIKFEYLGEAWTTKKADERLSRLLVNMNDPKRGTEVEQNG
jgi:hypothetical protein